MDPNAREHHTRSKAQSQELVSLDEVQQQLQYDPSSSVTPNIVKNENDETSINDTSNESKKEDNNNNEQQNEIFKWLKDIADKIHAQQNIIDSLTQAVATMQAGTMLHQNSASRDPLDIIIPINTQEQQSLPSIFVTSPTSLASQANKQLQAKRVAQLLESRSFTGSTNEDITDWLTEFDRKRNYVQLDNAQRLSVARGLLKGTAKMWSDTYEESITDWQTFKSKITSHFILVTGKDQFALEQQLYSRKKQINEDAITYYHAMIKLCSKVNPDMDEEKRIKHLTEGLGADAQLHIEQMRPKTADDLLQYLIKFEQLQIKKTKERNGSGINSLPGHQSSTSDMNNGTWPRQFQTSTQQQRSSTFPSRDPQNRSTMYEPRGGIQQNPHNNYHQQQHGGCYVCGAFDHYARNCPSKNY